MLKKFEDYNEKEQKAILKLYAKIGHDFGEKQEIIDRINNDLRYNYLTDHTVNLKNYFWYYETIAEPTNYINSVLDEEISCAIEVETLRILDDDEIAEIGLY